MFKTWKLRVRLRGRYKRRKAKVEGREGGLNQLKGAVDAAEKLDIICEHARLIVLLLVI